MVNRMFAFKMHSSQSRSARLIGNSASKSHTFHKPYFKGNDNLNSVSSEFMEDIFEGKPTSLYLPVTGNPMLRVMDYKCNQMTNFK